MLELAAVICGDPGKKELPKAGDTGAATIQLLMGIKLFCDSIANPEKISWPISPWPTNIRTTPLGDMLRKLLGENSKSWSTLAAREVTDSPIIPRRRPFLAVARNSLLD
jgi:hypothetical protein